MPAVLSELTFTDSEDDTSTIKISTTCGGGHMSWWAGGRHIERPLYFRTSGGTEAALAHITRLTYESGSGRLVASGSGAQLTATLFGANWCKPAAGPERDALIMGLVHMAKSAGDVTLEGFPADPELWNMDGTGARLTRAE